MFRNALVSLLTLGLTTSLLPAQRTREPPAVAIDGDGVETFVLISGMVGGTAGFRQLDGLLMAKGYRVLRIDPYQLSLDSADVSFAAMARRVDAVIGEYRIRRARVVAHSQGAGVALRLAATYPDRVEALYFLDSGALPYNRGPTLSASLRLVPILTRLPGGRSLVRQRFVDALRRSSGRSNWLNAERQHAYTQPVLDEIDRVVAMAFRLARAAEPESLQTIVSRVRAPLVVVIGAAPHEADIGAEEIEALAPLGALVQIKHLAGVGHFPHEEAPNDLVSVLIAPLTAPTVRVARVDAP
jgi:pimeloyl-ACP methyl ester carboxylesterase